MNVDIFFLLSEFGERAVSFFSNSFFITAIKFFLFVYVMILLADIVMLFLLRGFSSDLKQALFAANRPLLLRSTVITRWEKIRTRLHSDNPSQYKVALLEADAFADEVLAGIGYIGATMGEKIENIVDGQLETKAMLVEAHQIRNRIVREPDFSPSKEEVEKWLEQYKKFFDELELF
ncbi:MAG: hypothetical protein HYV45_01310 [Candidatus Moranbacteria bacterium]|nr:hypothetical protein [Candidatus Moranbacteria bacterium]